MTLLREYTVFSTLRAETFSRALAFEPRVPALLATPATFIPGIRSRGNGVFSCGPLFGGCSFYASLYLLAFGRFHEQLPRGSDIAAADAPLILGVEIMV